MQIEVTRADIDHGVRGDSESCPIALACQRTIPGCSFLTVGDETIELELDGDVIEIDLPVGAATFVHRFDEDTPVAPFTFELEG